MRNTNTSIRYPFDFMKVSLHRRPSEPKRVSCFWPCQSWIRLKQFDKSFSNRHYRIQHVDHFERRRVEFEWWSIESSEPTFPLIDLRNLPNSYDKSVVAFNIDRKIELAATYVFHLLFNFFFLFFEITRTFVFRSKRQIHNSLEGFRKIVASSFLTYEFFGLH